LSTRALVCKMRLSLQGSTCQCDACSNKSLMLQGKHPLVCISSMTSALKMRKLHYTACHDVSCKPCHGVARGSRTTPYSISFLLQAHQQQLYVCLHCCHIHNRAWEQRPLETTTAAEALICARLRFSSKREDSESRCAHLPYRRC
jgi:hypothetical protein